VGTTSLAVCAFPRELLWSGWCWFIVQLLTFWHQNLAFKF
jgi:hypothetical protein